MAGGHGGESVVSRFLRTWGLRLIGLLAFVFILSRADLRLIVGFLVQADTALLALAVPLFLAIILVKTWRWDTLLRAQGICLDWRELFGVYLSSFYAGAVTPGRVGELVKLFYIRCAGHSLARSLFSAVADRMLDVAFLGGVGYLGMLAFLATFRMYVAVVTVFGLAGLLALLALVVRRDWAKALWQMACATLVPRRLHSSAEAGVIEFAAEIGRVGWRPFVWAGVLTVVSWAVYYGQLWLLARALDINISVFNLVVFVSISSLISLIPITISGIGTRDATLILLFGMVGLSKESALAFSTLILMLFGVNTFISLLAWLRSPIRPEMTDDGPVS